MRAIAGIVFTLISALASNAWAFQTASPAPPRAPYIANPPHSGSKVSIAWLSEVAGEVELASAFGKDFQPALAQTAVTEGNIIRTGMGRAEVQLEDQSTIRLGPYSAIVFPHLELLPSGTKVSTVRGVRGTIYVSLMPSYIINTKGNEFQLTFGQEQVYLQPSGHIRLVIDPNEARLAMLDGKGRVDGPFGSMELAKKRTFTFSLMDQSQPAVAKKVTANPMDKWDTAAVAYHRHDVTTFVRGLFTVP